LAKYQHDATVVFFNQRFAINSGDVINCFTHDRISCSISDMMWRSVCHRSGSFRLRRKGLLQLFNGGIEDFRTISRVLVRLP
jgi:hypothetical protein